MKETSTNDQRVQLLTRAWFGDEITELRFPKRWEIKVLGTQIPKLPDQDIIKKLQKPIGTKPLSELVKGKQRILIISDDITRPTPFNEIFSFVIHELANAGVDLAKVRIIIAGGVHPPASIEEIKKKVGTDNYSIFKIIPHDSSQDLIYLGKTKRGTPLFVNKVVMESDFKISIGGIYPHPAAGFSGGGKNIMPGLCGRKTAQYLHDYIEGSRLRGGSIQTDFRNEIEIAVKHTGLDFILNVVLNSRREITGIFAGDKSKAYEEGVRYFKENYTVSIDQDYDILVSNTYPFDTSLNFARERGFWPIFEKDSVGTKIILAACPTGLGQHQLFPTSNYLSSRIWRRILNFNLKDFKRIIGKINTVQNILKRKYARFIFISDGIERSDLTKSFPNALLYKRWDDVRPKLERQYGETGVKVTILTSAPLYVNKAAL